MTFLSQTFSSLLLHQLSPLTSMYTEESSQSCLNSVAYAFVIRVSPKDNDHSFQNRGLMKRADSFLWKCLSALTDRCCHLCSTVFGIVGIFCRPKQSKQKRINIYAAGEKWREPLAVQSEWTWAGQQCTTLLLHRHEGRDVASWVGLFPWRVSEAVASPSSLFIFFTNSSTSFLDQNRRGKTFGSLRSPFIYCVPKKKKNPKKTKKSMEINPCLKLQHATFRSHIASRPIRFSAVVVRLELWRTSTPDRRRRQLYIVSQLFSFAADRKN